MNISTKCEEIRQNIEKVIVGKSGQIELMLAALLAKGHVLLEDVPGTGKTMLAKTLAKSVNCGFGRVQFTPDLLPSDLTGINLYNPKTGDFSFKRGALFTNILLADEINRATPRTQSGLLESMEERQITVDGVTYPLEPPYFVIATQNPVETHGTFPLPEAQLDRFLIKLSLGYPDRSESIALLGRFDKGNPMNAVSAVCSADELLAMQEAVQKIYVHEEIYGYIVDLAEKTRASDAVSLGVSSRGSLALMNVSKALAALQGREYVIPDDVQRLAPYVFSHRIIMRGAIHNRGTETLELVRDIIAGTRVPVEEWKLDDLSLNQETRKGR
ncbi:MAG: MoxR family ATPase [Clostridiales bacterium]|jgi:MoxR-like ATPase|nr:MoxR family ATPase [Clostridiales bacterium]